MTSSNPSRNNWTTLVPLLFLLELTTIKADGSFSPGAKGHYTTAHHELHRSLRSHYSSLQDFEIAVPEMVDKFGNHISHNLHRRVRRSFDREAKYFKLHAQGQNFHVELTPNYNLLHPSFAVRRIRRNAELKQKETDDKLGMDIELDCHYKGKMLSHEDKPTSISLCNGATGLLRTPTDDFLLEPIPPGVTHSFPNDQHPHIVYKKKGITDEEQHYCGKIKTHPMPVSTNDDIEYRYLSDGSFVVSPVNASFLEYQRSEQQPHVSRHARSKRGVESREPKIVETMVVADQEFIKKHKTDRMDVTTYILTVINMVDGLFRDGTLDTKIDITLIGLILLEDDKDLELGHRAGESLAKFCKWQSTVNMTVRKPDHSILFTGIDICADKDEPCDTLGLAEVGGMCNPIESCTINEDSGLGLAFTVAHETGHSLGMLHDGQGNSCVDRGGHIMSPTINTINGVFTWSSCSRRSLEEFLKTNHADCLENDLSDSDPKIPYPRELPGQLYSADEQCKLQFGRDRRLCSSRYARDLDYICVSLWCQSRDDNSCVTKHLPAIEGTPCGIHKWCRRGKCVPFGSGGPEPIDGDWSAYGPWSECSRTCGVGVSVKVRQCDNPEPIYGGRNCDGDDTLYKLCNAFECPISSVDYRTEQCAEYNLKPYRSQYFDWIPYTKYWKYGSNRCELLCEAEGYGFFDRLSPRVKDGTRCDDDENDVCIAGKCKTVGCDWVLHSTATPDLCGVCQGDNSSCRFVSGSFTERVPDSGYYFVTKIPAGAATIKIWEEDYRTHAYLAVKSAINESRYYLNGNWEVDMYEYATFAGSKWEYQRELGQPESLTTKGPITEAVVVEGLIVSKNTGISYSYYTSEIDNALPYEVVKITAKTSDVYSWQEDFSTCSKSCSGGFRKNNITCTRNGVDIVDDLLCLKALRPQPRTRRCNKRPCPARWETGDWPECSQTCGGGLQAREIFCMQTTSSGERNVSTDQCRQKDKPEESKSCHTEECARWKPGRWSECSKSCGRGQRTRLVFCRVKKVIMPGDMCELSKRPRTKRGCRVTKCRRQYRWLISAWNECSVTCGEGVRMRRVTCSRRGRGGGFRPAKRKRCKGSQKPRISTKKTCVQPRCPVIATTTVSRVVTSAKFATTKALEDSRIPDSQQPRWITGNWGLCSKICGGGEQFRKVSCIAGHVGSAGCPLSSKPSITRECNTNLCSSNTIQGESCVDRYSWCNLAPYHRTCNTGYFKALCCKTCLSSDETRATFS